MSKVKVYFYSPGFPGCGPQKVISLMSEKINITWNSFDIDSCFSNLQNIYYHKLNIYM